MYMVIEDYNADHHSKAEHDCFVTPKPGIVVSEKYIRKDIFSMRFTDSCL